jgi:hypothetical protein
MGGREPDERPPEADGRHASAKIGGVYLRPMSQGIENHIDWTVPLTPHSDRVGPGLARQPKPQPSAPAKRNVMDTLLGQNDLSAMDSSGTDPYNATGRQFRR